MYPKVKLIEKTYNNNSEEFEIVSSELRRPNGACLPPRILGNLAGRGWFLNSFYEYKIVLDDTGTPVLIAYKK